MDMDGRSPAALIRPAATLLFVASAAVLAMFSNEYPMHDVPPVLLWLVYAAIAVGFAGAGATAYRRLFPLALVAALLLFMVGMMDINVLVMESTYLSYVMPWTFLLSGSLSSLAVVFVVTARDAFWPVQETLRSRSSPSASSPRQERPSP
jgi:hypothetical protein